MHSAAMVADTYQKAQVQSRSPLELVVMLYDGADRYLSQARDAIERRDTAAKHEAISKALAVVAELQNNLNMDAGGEVAASLDTLYTFINEKIIEANVNNDSTSVDKAHKVLLPLREAWTELATATPSNESGETR